jgi:hypothetical protein
LITGAEATKARRVFTLKHTKIGLVMMNTDKKSNKGFWQRLNDAVTEVGVEHADDEFDWDQRVKLPEWQLVRLKERYVRRKLLNKQK